MCRPLWTMKLERASMRSSAVASICGRGGVRKRRSAQAPARPGASSAVAANRTFVLIFGSERLAGMEAPFRYLAGGGRAQARLDRRGVARNQLVEGGKRALARFLVAEQAAVVVVREDDAEHLEGDLLRIGAGLEVPFLDREAHSFFAKRAAAALVGDDRVADRARPVVVFVRRRDHDAASVQARGGCPVEPALEDRVQPRQSALDLERR